MLTENDFKTLVDDPDMKARADAVNAAVISEEYRKVCIEFVGHDVTEYAKALETYRNATYRLAMMAVLSTVENDALRDDNVALRKRLLPDGMPQEYRDYDPESEEPNFPKWEWLLYLAAAMICFGVAGYYVAKLLEMLLK